MDEDLVTDFHTYTLIWTPNELTWFYDGMAYRTDHVNIPNEKMDLQISRHLLKKFQPANDPWVDAPFIIDYIKIFKPKNDDYNLTFKEGKRKTARLIGPNNVAGNVFAVPQHVYYRGTDDQLYRFHYNNGWTLSMMNGPDNVESDVFAVSSGKVYYRGKDNKIYNSWNNSIYPLYGSNTVAGDIFAFENPGEVYYRNTLNELCRFVYIFGQWQHECLGSPPGVIGVESDIFALRDPNIVFYKGTDNRIWCYKFDTKINDWVHLPLPNCPYNVQGDLYALNDPLKVYYKSTSNKVYNAWWDKFEGIWKYNSLGWHYVEGDIVAKKGKVYYIGPNSNLCTYEWVNNSWNHNCFECNTNIEDGLGFQADFDKIYYKGNDNRIWNFYWDPDFEYSVPCDDAEFEQGCDDNWNFTICPPSPLYGNTQNKESSKYLMQSFEDNKPQLFQNSPNPFSESTKIKFKLNSGKGVIIISDLTGRVIKRFELSTPIGIVDFNDEGMSNGLYYYSLYEGGHLIDTKKFVKQ